MLKTKYLCLLTASAMLFSPFSNAAENGGSSYMPGFYGDFGMATAPAPGNYLSNFGGYYSAGDTGNNYDLLFELPGIIRVTDQKIAGGNYWVGFFPYVLHTSYNSTAADGTRSGDNRAGAGDMYALPIALSWQWRDVSLLAFEGVVMPTGSYSKTRALNSGRNYWTSDTNLAITWQPKDTGLELSMVLGYMVNSENPASQYRTGDELHYDYFGGYYFNPQFGLGIAGSYYRQVTPDSGKGVTSALPLAEYSSIGPAIMYSPKLGGKDVTFTAKWLHEFDVNNHLPGDYVIVRTSLGF